MGMLGKLLDAAKRSYVEDSKISPLLELLSKERREPRLTDLEVCGYHFEGGRPPYLCFETNKKRIDFQSIASLLYSLNKKGFMTKIVIAEVNNQTFYDLMDPAERRLFILHTYSNEGEDSNIASFEMSCYIMDVLTKKEFRTLEKALGVY